MNNHLMGEEINVTDPIVSISVNLAGRHDIRWVTVVKNNRDIYRYGGDGFTTSFTIEDEITKPGANWYYLRVEYEGPEMAWSSPVWVNVN